MKFQGKISLNEEGKITIATQISPQNPTIYDIPLIELLEDGGMIDKQVKIEFVPIKKEWELK